jgi:threonylcarbamoyladenosine tRNA methylthiotransferase MtaB
LKYSVVTFGCRVNQADSLGFEEELRAAGASDSSPETADLVIVNTCSVTSSADQGARQTIRRIARSNPSARIVVTGCYATRAAEEVRDLPNVLRVVQNDDKPRLVELLRAESFVSGVRLPFAAAQGTQPDLTTASRFGDGEGSCGAAIEPGVAGRTAFTLRVQTGCDEPCSYCIIPTTRGAPRSTPIDAILREVERVASAGFKEIALTGVHLGSYGHDLAPRTSLIELLGALSTFITARGAPPPLAKDLALERRLSGSGERQPSLLFRISSLEPMDCGADVVSLVATSGAFAPHFHLPLQHASNSILRAMRRPYTIEQYASLVDDIRARVPHAAIGSDVIVGFPGETDEDFELLASYLSRSPLTHLHVFPYSDRPGTEASKRGGRVHGAVVRERARRVRDISRDLASRFHESQVGVTHRGLTLEDGSLVVTGNYLKVRIPPGRARNEWVDVRIDEAGSVMSGTPGSPVSAPATGFALRR